MIIIDVLNKILNKVGIDVVRFPNIELKRRKVFLDYHQINKVLDVGANVGNYAVKLRDIGFKGQIISFEPLNDTYKKLEKKAKNDLNWSTLNIALGDFNGESEINIAGNIDSSSLLDMLPAHLNSAPQSKYIGKEKIFVKKLDDIFDEICKPVDCIYLKIDTQGFEKQILDGGKISLSKISAIQIEMSIIPLYKDSLTYLEMIDFLKKQNFELHLIESGFSDPLTGQLLQFDGVFIKHD
jgi:FkbM family methyltransferase